MQIKIAGAGAGKTSTMAKSVIEKRKELSNDKNIYCITFTNSAKDCIERKLNNFYGLIPSNIKLGTIHSFLYQEIIKPFYYLLFEKQFEHVSNIELSNKPIYRNGKISELERKGVLHVTVFTQKAKWVVCGKSSDRKKDKEKRLIILEYFKKYCGHIFVDEAQDMDKDMMAIIMKFHEISIPIELIGDPKQDLKGFNSLRTIISEFPKNTEYISECYRCPQNHLEISNSIVDKSERQYSNKPKSYILVYFESDLDMKTLITNKKYDLMYISEKNERYNTHIKLKENNSTETLFYELEQFLLEEEFTKNLSKLKIKQVSYFFAKRMIESYRNTGNPKDAMSILTKKYKKLDKCVYSKIIKALQIKRDDTIEKINVFSIDRVKGQEGKNCLFILTNDLAEYLFLQDIRDNKTKNKLYVALTRSLEILTIIISVEVEKKYGKKFVSDFFEEYTLKY